MKRTSRRRFQIRLKDPQNRSLFTGMNFYNDRLFAEAIACFDEALNELAGSHDTSLLKEAWKWKGMALGKLKRYEEELECYEQGIEVESNDSALWLRKADVLDDLERLEEALECYDRGLSFNQTLIGGGGDPWYDRGLVLRKL